MKGEAYVFRRQSGAKLLGVAMGHVGWGFLSDPAKGLYCFGSTENLSGQPYVAAGADNSAWIRTGNFQTMLSTMKQGIANAEGYDDYKRNWVEPIHAKRAYDIGATRPQAGYAGVGLPGNNCADHAYQVLEAYGVTGLPPLQIFPGPNFWFDQGLLFGWDYFRDMTGTCKAESAERSSGDTTESKHEASAENTVEAEGKLVKVKPRKGGGNSPKTALTAARGTTVEGELAAGEARHYMIDLKEGETIKFTIYTRLPTDANYASGSLAIQDEEGGILGETSFLIKATGEDFTRERYEFEAEDAGNYIFRIRSEDKDAERVTYKIKLA